MKPAPKAPPAAPSPPKPRRTPGTTNAPGGRWYSVPDGQRKSRPRRFTSSPEAEAAIAFLAGRGDASAEIRAAVVERAERRGWKREEKKS